MSDEDRALGLYFVGARRQRRSLVLVYGKQVWLPPQPFRAIWELVVFRRANGSDWLHVQEFEGMPNAQRALSRARQLIVEQVGPAAAAIFENDCYGRYRLQPALEELTWNAEVMASNHPELLGSVEVGGNAGQAASDPPKPAAADSAQA